MSLSPSDLANIRSNFRSADTISNVKDSVSNITSGLTAKVSDPIGSVIISTLSSINSLSANISSKLDKLEKDIIESVDSTGKVKLVGNTIVVTTNSMNPAKLAEYQNAVQSKVESARGSLNKLRVVSDSLNVVSKAATTLRTAMDVQEALLTLGNPVAKATMSLLKKALKIINYRDVLNSYVGILSSQVSDTKQVVNDLSKKLDNISIKFISDEDSNLSKSTEEVRSSIRDYNLTKDNGNVPEYYTSHTGTDFIITVEPYGTGELIGRARDKTSGLLITETAPSFIYTADQLKEELKTILNLQI